MGEEVTVSILIPVFNREDLVADCIQSALDQTFEDLEVVVVDNASTDGTWDVCRTCSEKDSRVRIYRNERNLGPVRNWMKCIELARGTYGKILFSDDLMRSGFLSRTVPFLEDDSVGFVFTATQIGKTADSGSINYRWRNGDAVVPSEEFIKDSLFTYGVDLPVSPGCAIFRMKDLRKNLLVEIPSPSLDGFAAYGAGNDLLIYLLTAMDYPNIGFSADPLSFFLAHQESISFSDGDRTLWRRYEQARVYFAEKYLDPVTTKRLLVRVWYSAVMKHNKLIKMRKLLQSFLDPVPDMGLLYVFKEIVRLGQSKRKKLKNPGEMKGRLILPDK